MAAIKPLGQSSSKWVRNAAGATGDYTSGVQNPRKSWSQSAKEAEPNYKSGVIAAANAGRYGKGVTRVGDQKWKVNTLQKGPGRFAEGVSLAQNDWQKGYGPYQQAFSAFTLPKRGPKGSPQNLQIVGAVNKLYRETFEKRT